MCPQRTQKVQQVPLHCSRSAVHSRDAPSEPDGAPGPACDSGKDGGTGSTTMSKSDTFQGPEGFRTPSAPGEETLTPTPDDPTPTPVRQKHHRGQQHVRDEERTGGEDVQDTAHGKRGRLEEKGITEDQVQKETAENDCVCSRVQTSPLQSTQTTST